MVAEELRRRIEGGAIPAGALLPPESALVQEFGISRGTAREAIAALRAEGLVVTEHGRGTYARPKLPVRRLSPVRYRRIAAITTDIRPSQPSSADGEIPWSAEQFDATFDEVPATRAIAELFGLQPETMLLRRRFVSHLHGVPEQFVTSYFPLYVVAGTPLASPTQEARPESNVAQLATLGITVTSIQEVVNSRMPTAEEAAVLHLPPGVPVLTIVRRTFAKQQVVEVGKEIVLPADRTELEYRIDFT